MYLGTTEDAPSRHPHAADFAEFFAAGWAIGAGDGFFEHFSTRLRPDSSFEQPLMPAARRPEQWRAGFERLFSAVPDLRGEVVRWGATADGLLIELVLRGTFGGRPLEWTTVDRIVLDDDGMLVSRRAHFDPLPLLLQMLRRPLRAARLLAGLVLAAGGR